MTGGSRTGATCQANYPYANFSLTSAIPLPVGHALARAVQVAAHRQPGGFAVTPFDRFGDRLMLLVNPPGTMLRTCPTVSGYN